MTTELQAISPSINGWNGAYLEEQYAKYRADPASVPADVRAFMQGFELALGGAGIDGVGVGTAAAGATVGGPAPAPGLGAAGLEHVPGDLREAIGLYAGVRLIIRAYRTSGHTAAKLDPFGRPRAGAVELDPAAHGLSAADLDRPALGHGLPMAEGATVREMIAWLEQRYCGRVGIRVMHLVDPAERQWLLDQWERPAPGDELTHAERVLILEQITAAEQFEKFLQKRYPGDKRFSLEGCETLIPVLEGMIREAAGTGVEEIVLGMAHRGRLNVLNNVLGKSYEQIFTEFEDNWEEDFVDGGGDVKYHRGYSGERTLPGGRSVHLAMASNPSHLESVGGVVCGRCRAKQRLRNDKDRRRVVPMLVHGDAAVIGQGVVSEVLNFSRLEGYTTGGTLHVVVNNLIGFTTGPEDGRSTPYCTDGVLGFDVPVFHVNASDPEAAVAVARLAVRYRQTFKKDVFIDLWGYRKYGHNEQDEPSFTQPVLAAMIRREPGILARYSEHVVGAGLISVSELEATRARLEAAQEAAQARVKQRGQDPTIDPASKRWAGMGWDYSHAAVTTGIDRGVLGEVARALGRVPEGFEVNAKLKRLLQERAGLAEQGDGALVINHADGELLAIGTLLLEGTAVRISGQDSRRGTFSQRHAVLRDAQTGAAYTPLNAMRPVAENPDEAGRAGPEGRVTQARLCVYDSPLSEFGVMAFDYGYSLADPNMLVCWEAQFGDFGNGAQVVIDQYLASAEIKWERWSGLTLLLPHGYEGAGPEHSSGRIERFLQLCADENMQVVYPSTGAQMFHLLRRQVRRNFRKPLVVFTPKSMLRVATATVGELLGRTGFRELIDDPAFEGAGAKPGSRAGVRRVLLCSGKIYHELAERRVAVGRADTAIVRVEQLYPFHAGLAKEILGRYPAGAEVFWVQEEPRNMGAYLWIADVLRREAGVTSLGYIGREASASPAVGSKTIHKHQQEAILSAAVGPMAKAAAAPAAAGGPAADGASGGGHAGAGASTSGPTHGVNGASIPGAPAPGKGGRGKR